MGVARILTNCGPGKHVRMPTHAPTRRPVTGQRAPSMPERAHVWNKQAWAFVRPPRGRQARPCAPRRVGWPDARPPCGPAVFSSGVPTAVIACQLTGLTCASRAGTAPRLQGMQAAHSPPPKPHGLRAPTHAHEACMPPHTPYYPPRPLAHPHVACPSLAMIGSGAAPLQPPPTPGP